MLRYLTRIPSRETARKSTEIRTALLITESGIYGYIVIYLYKDGKRLNRSENAVTRHSSGMYIYRR